MNSQDLQVRAATDPDFRAALITDPRKALAAEGVSLPDETAIRVEESTAEELVIAIPPLMPEGVELDDDALAGASGGAIVTITTLWLIGGASAATGAGVTAAVVISTSDKK